MKNDRRNNIMMSRNVYTDQNRLIYYDPLTKKAHQITKADEKAFIYFQTGIPAACLIAAVVAYYTKNYILAGAIGVLIALIVYLIFHFIFIARLPIYPKYTLPERKGMIDRMAEKNPKGKLLMTAIVMLGLAVLVIINAGMQDYDRLTDILNFGVAIGFIISAIISFMAYLRR